MNALKAELWSIATPVEIKISRLLAFSTFVFGLFLTIVHGFTALAFAAAISGNDRVMPKWAIVAWLTFSIAGFLLFARITLQAVKNLGNANETVFNLSKEMLTIRETSVPWSTVKGLALRTLSGGRLTATYALITLTGVPPISTGDLTDTRISFLFKSAIKQLAPPPGTLVVPLNGFDWPPSEVLILMRRFWCNSTGQTYRPISVELLYPQKKFEDFQKSRG